VKKAILLSFLFLCNSSVFSQNLPTGLNDWYLYANDNNRLYVAEGGQGAKSDTVIVLHGGWGAEYSYLAPAFRPLFDRYHFVFYDQRGSLRSPAPDSTISLQRFVQDLEELRQELGIDKVTLATHSMGSMLAYAYLQKYPDHVKGYLLIGPVPPKNEVSQESTKKVKAFGDSLAQIQFKEEGLAKDKLTDRERTKKWKIRFAAVNIYHIDRWRQMRGGHAFYNQGVVRPMYNNTPDSLWKGYVDTMIKYKKPIFVLIGDHDQVDFGLEVWPDFVKKIPNMELLKIKNASHAAWIDWPGKFQDSVNYALQQINNQ
jgi:pimeloyl-ACP methyl ester carboxylesterase